MPPNRAKKGLPLRRHEEIGPEFAELRDRLTHLSVEITRAYPKNSRIFRLAMRSTDVLDELRSELESAMFRENNDSPDLSTKVYYPPRI